MGKVRFSSQEMKIVGGNFWLMANYNLTSSLINKCVGFAFNGGTNFSGIGSGNGNSSGSGNGSGSGNFPGSGRGDFSNSYKVQNKNENFKLVFNKTCFVENQSLPPPPPIGGGGTGTCRASTHSV